MFKTKIYIFLVFNIFASTLLHAQPGLKWAGDNNNLAFLKGQSYMKYELHTDSSLLTNVPARNKFRLQAMESKRFESGFNAKDPEGLQVLESIVSSSYQYVLRITPQKYYLYTAQYLPSQGRMVGTTSYYVKGDYLIEIFEKSNPAPLVQCSMTGLMNKYPIISTSGIIYSQDINEEINRNMFWAGNATVKYIAKLIKKSK